MNRDSKRPRSWKLLSRNCFKGWKRYEKQNKRDNSKSWRKYSELVKVKIRNLETKLVLKTQIGVFLYVP